jgi:hypothetical protein
LAHPLTRSKAALHLLIGAALGLSASAAAAEHLRWYGTLGAGAAFLTDQDVTIQDPGLPAANGSLTHDIGLSGSATLGRYLGDDDGEAPRWRAELELLGFGADRDRFEGPAGADPLGGKVRGYGGFANLMYRVWERDDLRVWLGGGVGYVSLRMPNDTGSLENCGCLGPDRNGEATWRVKLVGEKRLNERDAAFAEVGYVDLPGGFSATAGGASTRYDDFGLINLHVGLRRDF